MKNILIILSVLLFTIITAHELKAQKVEVLYAKAGMKIAMGFKKSLKAEKITNFNAMALNKISGARKDAYLKKISGRDVVIVIGIMGLKSAASIDFTLPLITVDALGKTAAVGPIFRVISSIYWRNDIGDAVTISATSKLSLSKAQLKNGSNTIFRCQGIEVVEAINKIISEIIKNK